MVTIIGYIGFLSAFFIGAVTIYLSLVKIKLI